MNAPLNSIILSSALLLFLQATAHCGLKESNYDKERDEQMKENHKDMDQLRLQKMKDEAREKREKQQEQIRQINRDEHLRRHPAEFYNARIMGRYGVKDGKPVAFVPIEGLVHDILDEKRILIYIPAPQTDTSAATYIIVLVQLEKPQTLSRGKKFSIPNVIEAGTYGYTKPDGTSVSAKMYKETPGMTLKEFMQFKKDGYKFTEESFD